MMRFLRENISKKLLMAIEATAVLIGIGGLVFYNHQNDLQKLDLQNQIYEKMIEIDTFLIERPDARAYIYGDIPVKEIFIGASDKEIREKQMIAQGAAELMMDFFAMLMLSQETLVRISVETGPGTSGHKDIINMTLNDIGAFNQCAGIMMNAEIKNPDEIIRNSGAAAGVGLTPIDSPKEAPKLNAYNDWTAYMKDIYICSPILRKRLDQKKSWYLQDGVIPFKHCSFIATCKRRWLLREEAKGLSEEELQRCAVYLNKLNEDFKEPNAEAKALFELNKAAEKDRCDSVTVGGVL